MKQAATHRPCDLCGAPTPVRQIYQPSSRVRCPGCRRAHAKPGALVHPTRRYRDDVAAQLFVAHFADGATLEAVGLAMDVSRERVRQIETRAIASMRKRLHMVGLTEEAVASYFAERARRAA